MLALYPLRFRMLAMSGIQRRLAGFAKVMVDRTHTVEAIVTVRAGDLGRYDADNRVWVVEQVISRVVGLRCMPQALSVFLI